ncbi:MAG: hypothetical protein Q9194_006926 [Teloschistes cf. exilis]
MAEIQLEAYCTLLMSDEYLPGAMVLAHSLRDSGTKRQLVVLVTFDTLDFSTLDELQKVYDHVIPVDPIMNKTPANLYLMHRPDLAATFTKIALWRQIHFRKIVYLDADTVALRAPDELFDQKSDFAAVPDIGWPDCFNSGVLVLSPNMGDYYALEALAQRGISFDGADQGLLNMHFRDWHRLSFTYNCTPSGNYQYVPAYRHFQSRISMIHYIGTDKPWKVGRDWNGATGVYEELLGRWWAVYDKHYRVPIAPSASTYSQQGLGAVQKYVKGEASTFDYDFSSYTGQSPVKQVEPPASTVEKSLTEEHLPVELLPEEHETERSGVKAYLKPAPADPQKRYAVDWDPSREPPPRNSKPEAANFGHHTYEMSRDRGLFHPPPSYPEPPKDMYYQVPPTPPPAEQPKPIFPWEETQEKAARAFPDDPRPTSSESAPSIVTDTSTQSDTVSPATPSIQVTATSPPSFATQGASFTNAWDTMPEIDRYVANHPTFNRRRGQLDKLLHSQMPQLRKPKNILSPSNGSPQTPGSPNTEVPPTTLLAEASGHRRPSLRVTDFPSEFERPSLPVTPAPIRRPSFWGQERDAMGDLPPAEGVPNQQDWDPLAQLAELRRKQEEILVALARRGTERDVPKRMLVRSSVALPGYEASSSSSGTVKDTKGNSVKQAADAAEDEDEEPGASQSWSNIPPRRKFEERHAHFDI